MALSEAQIGALQTTMSDASVGAMLGRSAAWVARQRQGLAQGDTVRTAEVVPVAAPAPAVAPEIAAVAIVPVSVPARPAAVKPRRVRDWRNDERIKLLVPVTERIRAWGVRFLAAGWPVADIAGLFDVDPDALATVLGVTVDGVSADV